MRIDATGREDPAARQLALWAQAPRIWWKQADLASAAHLRARFEQPGDPARYRHHARRARSQSLAARALLRAMLQEELGGWWARAPVAYGAGGAPFLPDRPGCRISLSHSANQVAVAACTFAAVGIDIEWMDPDLRMTPVVRRCLHPREASALAGQPAPAQRDLLYAWWVAKEAVAKCLQLGLALPLASFIVPNPLGRGPVLGLEADVWTCALPAPPGYRAALAWREEAD